jgi:hypothetical protein
MMAMIRSLFCASLLALLFLAGGCGPRRPVFTDAEGTVTLNGKPLPYAQVEFVPLLEGYGAEFNSLGITDENGHFTLRCGDKPGAVIAKHRIVVREGPAPKEARSPSEEGQQALTEHMKKLKNRPIPARYGSAVASPLQLDVKADQKTYDLELTGS